MKVILFCLPNTVSESDLAGGLNILFNELGIKVPVRVFSENDAKPIESIEDSSYIKAVKALIKACGVQTTSPTFKSVAFAAVLNNGNVNTELLKILSNPSKIDLNWLYRNNIQWIVEWSKSILNVL
jgi:hypothetical protein